MKILLFEPNWLGDVIMTTPALAALKGKFPKASIDCIVSPRCKDILVNNPYIGEIIEFDERGKDKSLGAKIKFINTLKKKKYSAVILFHRSFTRTLVCAMARIPQRIGYAYKKRSFLLTHKVRPLNKDKVHKQDYYLGILDGFGLAISDKSCQLYVSEAERTQAKELIGNTPAAPLIAINPFTNWQPKNWPLQSFKEFIELMTKKYPKVRFFITSARDDPQLAQLPFENVVNLAGKTNIRQLIALYQQMDLVVSGDSGPLHLAAAVGTKYIGIYGATLPQLNKPRSSAQGKILFHSQDCELPCYVKECDKDNICMKSITPDEAASAALRLL